MPRSYTPRTHRLHHLRNGHHQGWHTFVDVGLAFPKIKDGQLYREEFDTFDAYCRAKWNYTRTYVYQLMSAAELFTHLSANCIQKPDHESQARIADAAVKKLDLPPPEEETAKAAARQRRSERRGQAIEGMKELVGLIVQNVPHGTLLEKAEALAPLLNLFSTKTKSSK